MCHNKSDIRVQDREMRSILWKREQWRINMAHKSEIFL